MFRGIEALLAAGHEVHYLAVERFPIEHPNCRFHRFPWPQNKTDTLIFWAFFHLIAPLQLLLIGLRYRITHVFAFGPTYGLLLQPLRRVKRIPLVIFLRADTIENHKLKERSGWLIQLELILEALAIRRSWLYGVSTALIEQVSSRHQVILSGQGTFRNDAPEPEKDWQAPVLATPIRTACVGILEERKNLMLVIHALVNIPASHLVVSFYGIGSQSQALRLEVETLGLQSQVNFQGWVPTQQIWAETDILLMPSLHEGAPNSVLEALARKIPVVASDIPEHREILSGGNLLPPDDVAAWHDCLVKIANQPELELTRIREGQLADAAALKFDWDARFVATIVEKTS